MTLSKEELSALIERVRGLKGADRDVDAAMAKIAGWHPNGYGCKMPDDVPAYWYSDAFGLPSYTGSIYAIRALTDRLLDGNNGRPLLYGRTSEWAAMALPEHQYTETLNFAVGEAPALKMLTVSERAETECAAALLALLLSLQSQEPTP